MWVMDKDGALRLFGCPSPFHSLHQVWCWIELFACSFSRMQYLIHFFLRFTTNFPRFCKHLLEFFKCSPIRSFIFRRRYIPILTTFLCFLKKSEFRGRSLEEPPEGLENVPDILTQNFLEISDLTATGTSSDQQALAGLSQAKKERSNEVFSRIVKAQERTCWFAASKMS